MEFIKGLEDGSVDMVLTDPPYSSGGQFRGDRTRRTSDKYQRGADIKPEFYGDTRDQRSLEKWFVEWMRALWPKVKDGGQIACFIDWRNLACVIDALQVAGFVYRGCFAWCKTNGRPQKGTFRNDVEFVVYGTHGQVIQCEKYARGWYEAQPLQTAQRVHATEKPVELLEHLLTFVPDGGLVVDPFAGGGSTGVASHRKGLRFEGCELSGEYCRLANERIGREEAQQVIELDVAQ